MAYWGEALSYNQPLWYNEDVGKARAVLARLAPTRAARQAKAPTAREKAYLDAVERLFGDGGKAERDRAYAEAMAAITRQFPDDEDAAALYALALLATRPSGERDTAVSLKAGGIASAVLAKNPEHPGAAHYALHAFDDGEHAAMGLKAARIYARIAPASSHARHMPSHIFLPLGMWDEAVASDESAFAASVDRVKRLGLSMAQADFHSLSWLHYEYLQQGRFAKARELMRTVERAIAAPHADPWAARQIRSRPDPPGPRDLPGHTGHAESEIGRGYDAMSLKGELASMKARLVIETARLGADEGAAELRQHRRAVRARRRQRAAGDRGARRRRARAPEAARRRRCPIATRGRSRRSWRPARGDDAARARRSPGRAGVARARARSSRRGGRSRSRDRIR